MRQKLPGYLFACSYANSEIRSELCQRINVAVKCTRSANERKKKLLEREEENNISSECSFERHRTFIDP